MSNRRLFRFGLVGTIIAVICCFTPLLVVVFGALGIGAMIVYADYVLLPALALLVLITVIGYFRKSAA